MDTSLAATFVHGMPTMGRLRYRPIITSKSPERTFVALVVWKTSQHGKPDAIYGLEGSTPMYHGIYGCTGSFQKVAALLKIERSLYFLSPCGPPPACKERIGPGPIENRVHKKYRIQDILTR